MSNPARKTAFTGLVANSATAVYTYTGPRAGFAIVTFASFCNTSGAAATITMSIVDAAGTITDAGWRLIDTISLDSKQSLWYFEDAGVEGSVVLRDGDRLVLLAGTASAIAGRVIITENNGG
jgi:hypothetical protein